MSYPPSTSLSVTRRAPRIVRGACPLCGRSVRVAGGVYAQHVPLNPRAALDVDELCAGTGSPFTPEASA